MKLLILIFFPAFAFGQNIPEKSTVIKVSGINVIQACDSTYNNLYQQTFFNSNGAIEY
jgi:hypothetical protein